MDELDRRHKALQLLSAGAPRHVRWMYNNETPISNTNSASGISLNIDPGSANAYHESPFIRAAKNEYISTARDIVGLGRGIATSWLPVARMCQDSRLSTHLLRSLAKVETLSGQMRAVTSQKASDESDCDVDGQVVACARNMLDTAHEALRDLEAAKLRLDDEALDCGKMSVAVAAASAVSSVSGFGGIMK
ncbi:hypothetical protein HK102_003223 [Quaeritorhiza haematococci]|nr:hypothetical protein HK102_003223 [Quaeritorhiza haematococci]